MASFPDEALTAETVLISGPPMTGEYRLFHLLLAERGSVPIAIVTGTPASEFRNHHEEFVGDSPGVRVVDCISRGRDEGIEEDSETRYVDSPGNLTAIGVKATEFIEELQGTDAVVGIHSLSQLLMHAGLEQTYQFVHILAQQTASVEMPLIAVINERAHEDRTLNAMYDRFNCLIKTRTIDGTNHFRTRTSMNEPGDWMKIMRRDDE